MCIDIACIDIACIDIACIDIACIDIACIDIACIDIACIDIACIAGALATRRIVRTSARIAALSVDACTGCGGPDIPACGEGTRLVRQSDGMRRIARHRNQHQHGNWAPRGGKLKPSPADCIETDSIDDKHATASGSQELLGAPDAKLRSREPAADRPNSSCILVGPHSLAIRRCAEAPAAASARHQLRTAARARAIPLARVADADRTFGKALGSLGSGIGSRSNSAYARRGAATAVASEGRIHCIEQGVGRMHPIADPDRDAVLLQAPAASPRKFRATGDSGRRERTGSQMRKHAKRHDPRGMRCAGCLNSDVAKDMQSPADQASATGCIDRKTCRDDAGR